VRDILNSNLTQHDSIQGSCLARKFGELRLHILAMAVSDAYVYCRTQSEILRRQETVQKRLIDNREVLPRKQVLRQVIWVAAHCS